MTDDKIARDAGTGRFVTDEYAAANPTTTVHETVHRPDPIDAGYIARQLWARAALLSEYEGFELDESSVNAEDVPPGSIRLRGFLGEDDDGDPTGEVTFWLTVHAVEVDQ